MPDNTLESRKLLDYTVDILPIQDFKEFYVNCKNFNSYSERSFLKSVDIPATYFLEQPESTKIDLLDNKEQLIKENISSKKYNNKVILILKRGIEILSCTRIDYDEFDDNYHKMLINTQLDIVPNIIITIKEHIKDGYISLFMPKGELTNDNPVLGVYIDFPITLKKQPALHIGYYSIPKTDEEFDKCMYVEDIVEDFNNYTGLDFYIDYAFNSIDENKYASIIETYRQKQLLHECDEILLNLEKDKVIPKSFARKISKYINKNDIQIIYILNMVDVILKYDFNIKSYKKTLNLRSCLLYFMSTTKNKGCNNENNN